ncbi:MAG: peptidase Ste24p [Gemmatimonadetes bacterium]|jgi:predicted Zn-dependent protease|nr:peptidase Ste24p [Gemmatimonadota bacterium]
MKRVYVLVALCAVIAGCAVSTQQEVQMGQNYASQLNSQLPVVNDPVVEQYINQLGDSIAHLTGRGDLDWHFFVVNTDVVNAFALPGGFIYVNRGIIERADKMDELAGVMGHEIGHVVKRHSVKQMQQQQGANIGVALTCVLTHVCDSQASQAAIQVGGAAVFASFSRQDEKEADEEGFKNVVRAGISPKGMETFFQKLLAEQKGGGSPVDAWFSDHPLTQDRIADIQGMMAKLDPAILRTLTEDSKAFHAFKDRVHALPPGPKPNAATQP